MNCPNCGAENDAEARFCAECGAPLEHQEEIESTIAGRVFEESDDDMTIMSSVDRVAAEAKTVAVDQAQLAATSAADEGVVPDEPEAAPRTDAESSPPWLNEMASTAEPEPTPPFPGVSSAGDSIGNGNGSGSNDGGGLMSQRNIIIAIVVLLFLCCCCSLIIGGVAGSGILQDIPSLDFAP